jgi:hypothetical protein
MLLGPMAGVLTLPATGRLLVATDLQGHLRDFERMADLFGAAMVESDGDAYLLFTGDLIHGPHLEPEEWPDFLGQFYRDDSPAVMDGFLALAARFPGRVHALLGNHEHGHIGGPHTAKFAADEVMLLEERLGPEGSRRLQGALRALPLVAVAPCGLVFTHGAPAAEIKSLDDVRAASIDVGVDSTQDIMSVPIVGPILWARAASDDCAARFVRAAGGSVSVYGHDVVAEGYEKIGDRQIIVSTSFGVEEARKTYLDVDLTSRYDTVHDLKERREILPLYPDAAVLSATG